MPHHHPLLTAVLAPTLPLPPAVPLLPSTAGELPAERRLQKCNRQGNGKRMTSAPLVTLQAVLTIQMQCPHVAHVVHPALDISQSCLHTNAWTQRTHLHGDMGIGPTRVPSPSSTAAAFPSPPIAAANLVFRRPTVSACPFAASRCSPFQHHMTPFFGHPPPQDFGLSCFFNEGQLLNEVMGSAFYVAPGERSKTRLLGR